MRIAGQTAVEAATVSFARLLLRNLDEGSKA